MPLPAPSSASCSLSVINTAALQFSLYPARYLGYKSQLTFLLLHKHPLSSRLRSGSVLFLKHLTSISRYACTSWIIALCSVSKYMYVNYSRHDAITVDAGRGDAGRTESPQVGLALRITHRSWSRTELPRNLQDPETGEEGPRSGNLQPSEELALLFISCPDGNSSWDPSSPPSHLNLVESAPSILSPAPITDSQLASSARVD